jgi:hypothetical protein
MKAHTFNVQRFYDALEAERARRNVSWRDVGRATGLSSAIFTRMKAGRRLDVDSFAVLVQWLGSPARTFFDDIDQPAKERK